MANSLGMKSGSPGRGGSQAGKRLNGSVAEIDVGRSVACRVTRAMATTDFSAAGDGLDQHLSMAAAACRPVICLAGRGPTASEPPADARSQASSQPMRSSAV